MRNMMSPKSADNWVKTLTDWHIKETYKEFEPQVHGSMPSGAYVWPDNAFTRALSRHGFRWAYPDGVQPWPNVSEGAWCIQEYGMLTTLTWRGWLRERLGLSRGWWITLRFFHSYMALEEAIDMVQTLAGIRPKATYRLRNIETGDILMADVL